VNPCWLGFTQAVPGLFHAAPSAKRSGRWLACAWVERQAKERNVDMGYPSAALDAAEASYPNSRISYLVQ